MRILASSIGAPGQPAGFPTPDIEGLFDALTRWPLSRSMDFSSYPEFVDLPGNAPYRGRAWGHCVRQYNVKAGRFVDVATKPIHPDHPDAVRYCGNFDAYSFAFWLDTDDQDLIARLDGAIAANIRRFHKSFQLGDVVVYTNDNGVKLHGRTLTGKEEDMHGRTRFFYAPSDSPWFPVPEESLALEVSSREELLAIVPKQGALQRYFEYRPHYLEPLLTRIEQQRAWVSA